MACSWRGPSSPTRRPSSATTSVPFRISHRKSGASRYAGGSLRVPDSLQQPRDLYTGGSSRHPCGHEPGSPEDEYQGSGTRRYPHCQCRWFHAYGTGEGTLQIQSPGRWHRSISTVCARCRSPRSIALPLPMSSSAHAKPTGARTSLPSVWFTGSTSVRWTRRYAGSATSSARIRPCSRPIAGRSRPVTITVRRRS